MPAAKAKKKQPPTQGADPTIAEIQEAAEASLRQGVGSSRAVVERPDPAVQAVVANDEATQVDAAANAAAIEAAEADAAIEDVRVAEAQVAAELAQAIESRIELVGRTVEVTHMAPMPITPAVDNTALLLQEMRALTRTVANQGQSIAHIH